MAASQATATGTLGSTPIANLLIYALDRRLTGTLVLEDELGRKSAIFFRAGSPNKVKVAEPIAKLREVVVALRLVDLDVAASADSEAEEKDELLGRVLVARGAIDSSTLDEALEEQVLRRVEWLCGLGAETVYGYYEGVDLLAGYGAPDGVVVEPLAVTWRALRLLTKPEVVDATLAKVGSRQLRLHPQSRAAKFRFDPREQAVVDVLRAKPQPLPNLLSTGLLPEAQLKRVVYALVVTRHLDLGSGALPVGASEQSLIPAARSFAPGARASTPALPRISRSVTPSAPRSSDPGPRKEPPKSPSPPAPGRSPTISESPSDATKPASLLPSRDEAFIAEIREVAAGIGEKNYYEVLGVERDVAGPLVQAAFFRLAKRWHPDRLGVEFADVKELAVRVFARMTEAHQTLSNDEQRREYDRLLGGAAVSSAEQEEVQRVLKAVTSFQKAEVLVKRGNLAEAQKQAEIAVQNDPEQAEYVALFADILSQSPERQKTSNFADVVKMVNEARKRQPDNLKVRLYRARVLSRSGDAEAAYREFRNIVEQDANNVEAAREVRLYEMRRGKRTTDPRQSSAPDREPRRSPTTANGSKSALNQDIGQIFGKLFKR